MTLLKVENLTLGFDTDEGRIIAIDDISFELESGEVMGLVGESGSGKSTLLQAVGLLEGGFGGEIAIAGNAAQKSDAHARTLLRRDHLGFVYQFHHLLPEFTALENVVLPQLANGVARGAAEARAETLLATVGLQGRGDLEADGAGTDNDNIALHGGAYTSHVSQSGASLPEGHALSLSWCDSNYPHFELLWQRALCRHWCAVGRPSPSPEAMHTAAWSVQRCWRPTCRH